MVVSATDHFVRPAHHLRPLQLIEAIVQPGGDRVAAGWRSWALGVGVNGSGLLSGLNPLGGHLGPLPLLSGAYAIVARQPKPALHGFNARADVELLVDLLQMPLDRMRGAWHGQSPCSTGREKCD